MNTERPPSLFFKINPELKGIQYSVAPQLSEALANGASGSSEAGPEILRSEETELRPVPHGETETFETCLKCLAFAMRRRASLSALAMSQNSTASASPWQCADLRVLSTLSSHAECSLSFVV